MKAIFLFLVLSALLITGIMLTSSFKHAEYGIQNLRIIQIYQKIQNSLPYNIIPAINAISVSILFFSFYLLKCDLLSCFCLLSSQFILVRPGIDYVLPIISLNILVLSLFVHVLGENSGSIKKMAFLVTISGIISGISMHISVEFISMVIFSFFIFLFFWLKSHKIGEDDASAANSAMATIVLFVLSFCTVFFTISHFSGYPPICKHFWSFKSTIGLKHLPFFQTILTVSIIPSFFTHHESNKFLFALTGYICAELFRFLPASTLEYDKEITETADIISKRISDISSIIIASSSSSMFIALFSTACYISLHFLRYCFDFFYPA